MKKVLSFTLIELLVVISIVSLLAALLLPALKGAKEQANTVKCMSNLRQIGIAVDMYGQDKGYYPLCGFIPWARYQGWFSYILSPYLGKPDACFSPAIQNSRSPVFHCPSSITPGTNLVCSYAMNVAFGLVPPFSDPRPFPYLTRPSEIITFMDASQLSVNLPTGGESMFVFYTNPKGGEGLTESADVPVEVGDNLDSPPGMGGGIRFRHNNNTLANALFVDGHVASLHMDKVLQRNVSVGE